MCVLMFNFVSYFVCVILCIFVFLCDILLPSGVINDDYHSICQRQSNTTHKIQADIHKTQKHVRYNYTQKYIEYTQ